MLPVSSSASTSSGDGNGGRGQTSSRGGTVTPSTPKKKAAEAASARQLKANDNKAQSSPIQGSSSNGQPYNGEVIVDEDCLDFDDILSPGGTENASSSSQRTPNQQQGVLGNSNAASGRAGPTGNAETSEFKCIENGEDCDCDERGVSCDTGYECNDLDEDDESNQSTAANESGLESEDDDEDCEEFEDDDDPQGTISQGQSQSNNAVTTGGPGTNYNPQINSGGFIQQQGGSYPAQNPGQMTPVSLCSSRAQAAAAVGGGLGGSPPGGGTLVPYQNQQKTYYSRNPANEQNSTTLSDFEVESGNVRYLGTYILPTANVGGVTPSQGQSSTSAVFQNLTSVEALERFLEEQEKTESLLMTNIENAMQEIQQLRNENNALRDTIRGMRSINSQQQGRLT